MCGQRLRFSARLAPLQYASSTVAVRLPDPMLTRLAELPLGPRHAFEVKDGFRAVVSTVDGLPVRAAAAEAGT